MILEAVHVIWNRTYNGMQNLVIPILEILYYFKRCFLYFWTLLFTFGRKHLSFHAKSQCFAKTKIEENPFE